MNHSHLYKFTVFTATFNRADILPNVYESLRLQTFKDFEWIVVDDGSTDGTRGLIEKWIKEKEITIRYFKQENKGKHTAINFGVSKAQGELFLIIDSDDICVKDALEILNDDWNNIVDDEKVKYAGIFSNCKNKNGNIIGNKFPQDIFDSNMLDIYYKYGVKGDKWGFFRIDILKEFVFPEIKGEKFITEALIWNQISLKYLFRFINKQLLIVEYQEDGLSQNSFKVRAKNPIGTCLYYKSFLSLPVPLHWKFRAVLNYIRFYSYLLGSKYKNKII